MRALWGASIWHPDAIPDSEGEVARDLKRWVLPTIDGLLIIGSILGLMGGMPTLAIVYSDTVGNVAAVAVLLFSVGCLVGVSFPALWALEATAKSGLAFVLLLYGAMLLVRALSGAETGFIAFVTAALSAVPVARIIWLGREYRRRRLLEQAAMLLAKGA